MTRNTGQWGGRSVLVTGHTGFKGSWLSLWLHGRNAEVHGIALDPPSSPSLFATARVSEALASDSRFNLADLDRVRRQFAEVQPEIVFHLAAQSLVRESYRNPVETLMTNVMGTSHVLEASRGCDSVQAVVVVTTDKVYANKERGEPYRESDELGGYDLYSASKAAADLVSAGYRSSFFLDRDAPRVATARAGNVIGGGDWAQERLVPDCVRAFAAGEHVVLRNPHAVRPWQHVLDCLTGYIRLAERLTSAEGARFARAWNFAPGPQDHVTVGELAEAFAGRWGGPAGVDRLPGEDELHESSLLRLDSTDARELLGWQPVWNLDAALDRTVAWYRAWAAGDDLPALTRQQIDELEGLVVSR